MNDPPAQVNSFYKLFADDAKLYKDLQNLEDFESLQEDLDKLCQWTIKNPGRFGPIPVRSGHFGQGRFGPISGVGRFSPVEAGRFGPIS